MADPLAGTYKARILKDTFQFGESENGTPQMSLMVSVPDLGTFGTSLFFSAGAAPYSYAKLKAAGWKGSDLSDLSGLGDSDVLVTIKYETYEGKQQMRVELAGGGGFTPAKPMSQQDFAKKVAAITSAIGGGPAPTGNTKPPF
jgi:hypothetical protein